MLPVPKIPQRSRSAMSSPLIAGILYRSWTRFCYRYATSLERESLNVADDRLAGAGQAVFDAELQPSASRHGARQRRAFVGRGRKRIYRSFCRVRRINPGALSSRASRSRDESSANAVARWQSTLYDAANRAGGASAEIRVRR